MPINWLIWVMPPVIAAGSASHSSRLTLGVSRGRRKPMEMPAWRTAIQTIASCTRPAARTPQASP